MRESRSPPPFNEEPQISKDFWGFFVFLPADLFLLRWGYSSPGAFTSDFFFIGFHGWIGRQSCLSDYSRISAEFGRWPMARARNGLLLFLSRRFRRWRRFFLIDYLSPTDFTDLHRFFSLIIFLMGIYTDFLRFSSFSCHFFFFSVISFFFADFRPVGLGGWRRFLISWTWKGLCRFF